MRKLALPILIFCVTCTTTTPPPPAESSEPSQPYGMTVAEEARILALEDRREYDPTLVAEWVKHPNPLHRMRIALALGRIGPHTFADADGDRELDANEAQAGVAELITLAADPDRGVREMTAFALGEIGDRKGAEALVRLTADADFGVAAEAVEGLSKLGGDPNAQKEILTRYPWLTDPKWPDGLRARALRFLFRFNDDTASAAAMNALNAPSELVRQEAAYALARRAYAPARGPLELLLTDSNVLTRAYAATALGRISEGPSLPKLIDALGDTHPWVRTNAALAAVRVGLADGRAIHWDHTPRILAAADDPD